jgi:hypothetical protein
VVALVLLAAVARFAFVLRLPDLPLYWDEVHYDSWAKNYAAAWQSIATPPVFARTLRTAFVASLQKGEVYSVFVGAIYALVGARPRAVFLVQSALDVGTCVFMYGVASEIGGPSVGLLALVLSAVYEPFIFSAARLQSETLCAFLYVGALWTFVRRPRRWHRLAPAASGTLLALAMLTRPALQFLPPLWLATVGWVERSASKRSRLTRSVVFALGFFLVIGPRLAVTASLTGHPLWSGTLDPSIYVYGGAVIRNAGWQTDHLSFAFPPRDELQAVLREHGRTIATEPDYRLAALQVWERHPWDSVRVVLHKLYQAWLQPYNHSLRTFLTPPRGQQLYHQAMLVLGAMGVPLALQSVTSGLPLAITALYLWGNYLAKDIEVRYVVTVMPLMICFGALAVVLVGRGCIACWRRRRSRGLWALGAALIIAVILLHRARLGWLVGAPLNLPPVCAYDLHRGLAVLVMLVATALFFGALRAVVSSWLAFAATALPCVAGALVFLIGGTLANIWHQWQCPLRAGDCAVQEHFMFPEGLPRPVYAELRLDLAADGPGRNDLVVSINGQESKRFVGGPARANAVPAEVSGDAYQKVFAGQARAARPWHAWYAVAIDPSLIGSGQHLQVEARVAGDPGQRDVVRVFGDYPSDSGTVYDGPSPLAPDTDADMSIYKYLGDGDFRLRRQYPLNGESRSSYFDGLKWTDADLSPLPGRQYGRYRILLLLTFVNGQTLLF